MLVQYEGWLSTFQLLLPILIILSSVENGNTGTTSTFVRTEWPSIDIPLDHEVFRIPKGHNAPQQVHITQGDYEGKAVIISWVSVAEPGPSQVQYGTSENKYVFSAEGTVTNYSFYGYQSGYIHHCLIDGLEYDTKYYYKIGVADSSREFWFRTPPKIDPDASYTFGIIGDLGQTHNSLSTIKHYMQTRGQTVLFVGDLSYADNYKYNDTGVRWDSWSRFIERSAAYQPWIWSAGNHEIEERFFHLNHIYIDFPRLIKLQTAVVLFGMLSEWHRLISLSCPAIHRMVRRHYFQESERNYI